MGRLIDADTLLKKFDDTGIHITFDLLVEEILGEGVDIDDFSVLVQDAIQAYRKMVIETIKEQPTAYDLEAVVAELENKELESSSAQTEAIIGMCGASANYYCGEKDAYAKAISIVRGKE